MGLMIDTCVFIHEERQPGSINFSQWADEAIYISVITASELLMGMHKADNEARRLKRAAFIEAILAKLPVLDVTLEVARIHAELHAQLVKQGKNIGAHNLIIAATALRYGHVLLTSNHHEFTCVPGLRVEII